MSVRVVNATKQRLDASLIKRAVEGTLKKMKKQGDISVVAIGDQRMRTLNRNYRGKDRVTDVLSFCEAESEIPENGFLGELFINCNTIRKQAKRFAPSYRYELAFIAIHGTLHLLGYEDESEEGRALMERLGMTIIKNIRL